MSNPTLTVERVRELLDYFPETGVFRWRVKVAQRVHVGDVAGSYHKQHRYWSIRLGDKSVKAHRLAWFYMTGEWPDRQIDHRDQDRANNAWSNLRLATNSENQQNIRQAYAGNRSGLLGVTWNKGSRKWQAQIQVDGQKVYLGYFTTPVAAHEAYLTAKRRLHPFSTV